MSDQEIPIEQVKSGDLDALFAKYVLGCKPEWSEHYGEWCCPCRGGAHTIDSQCSIVADYSNNPRWLTALARRGGAFFDPRDHPAAICLAALKAKGFTHASPGPLEMSDER